MIVMISSVIGASIGIIGASTYYIYKNKQQKIEHESEIDEWIKDNTFVNKIRNSIKFGNNYNLLSSEE